MKNLKSILSLFLMTVLLNANSQVIVVGDTLNFNYVDIPDTTLPLVPKSYSEFFIDIDNDQVDYLRFYRAHQSSSFYFSITHKIFPLTSVQIACIDTTSYIDTLSLNSLVNEDLNWGEYDNMLLYYHFVESFPPPGSQYSNGICTGDNYIGFRKIYTNDTLYGWFHLNMDTYTILSYATDDDATSVSSIEVENDFKIYPNPARNSIYIKSSTFITQLDIYNLSGHKVKSYNNLKNELTVNISSLTKGLYFYQANTTDNKLYCGKLIVN